MALIEKLGLADGIRGTAAAVSRPVVARGATT